VPEGHVWVYKALCFPSWTASAERASVRAELNCAQAWHSLQAGILWVYGIRNWLRFSAIITKPAAGNCPKGCDVTSQSSPSHPRRGERVCVGRIQGLRHLRAPSAPNRIHCNHPGNRANYEMFLGITNPGRSIFFCTARTDVARGAKKTVQRRHKQ